MHKYTAEELNLSPIEEQKVGWLYSVNQEQDAERRCVGHLRGDFGRDGGEFWTSWFDHVTELKVAEFRKELDDVVNSLRDLGLLKNYREMYAHCRACGTVIERGYGFHMETSGYEYCLRCIPYRGDYNFYLYCYKKGD